MITKKRNYQKPIFDPSQYLKTHKVYIPPKKRQSFAQINQALKKTLQELKQSQTKKKTQANNR